MHGNISGQTRICLAALISAGRRFSTNPPLNFPFLNTYDPCRCLGRIAMPWHVGMSPKLELMIAALLSHSDILSLNEVNKRMNPTSVLKFWGLYMTLIPGQVPPAALPHTCLGAARPTLEQLQAIESRASQSCTEVDIHSQVRHTTMPFVSFSASSHPANAIAIEWSIMGGNIHTQDTVWKMAKAIECMMGLRSFR